MRQLTNLGSQSKVQLLGGDVDLAQSLPAWSVAADRKEIAREFIFKDFKSAFEFMTLCANFAEEIDHHPDWSNAWNKVSVRLSTHSMGGLTQLDITMALAMDQFSRDITA